MSLAARRCSGSAAASRRAGAPSLGKRTVVVQAGGNNIKPAKEMPVSYAPETLTGKAATFGLVALMVSEALTGGLVMPSPAAAALAPEGREQVALRFGEAKEEAGNKLKAAVEDSNGNYGLKNQTEGAIDKIKGAADNLGGKVSGAAEDIKGQAGGAFKEAKGNLKQAVSSVPGQPQFEVAFGGPKTQAEGIADKLKGKADNLGGKVSGAAENLKGQTKGLLNGAKGNLKQAVSSTTAQPQFEVAGLLPDSAKEILKKTIAEPIERNAVDVPGGAADMVRAGESDKNPLQAKGVTGDAAAALRVTNEAGAFQSAPQNSIQSGDAERRPVATVSLAPAFGGGRSAEKVQETADAVKDGAAAIKNNAFTSLKKGFSGSSNAVDDLKNKASDSASAIKNNAFTSFKKVANNSSNAVDDLKNKTGDAANTLKANARNVTNSTPGGGKQIQGGAADAIEGSGTQQTLRGDADITKGNVINDAVQDATEQIKTLKFF